MYKQMFIFKGHEANAQKLLEPYLPKGEADQFGFKEGGSLYAYGIFLNFQFTIYLS